MSHDHDADGHAKDEEPEVNVHIGTPPCVMTNAGGSMKLPDMVVQRSSQVHFAENLDVLRRLPDEAVDLIYVDPPFNTGKTQRLDRIETVSDEDGDRVGFKGRRYRSTAGTSLAYGDRFDDYLGFMEPRLREFRRVLKRTGSLYFHIDYREVHYCKVLLDQIFGRDCFLNEVIWAYDYGARSTRRWPAKHDNILVFVKDPASYYFSFDEVERIPYLAPGLVGPEKAARGKTPTDTWWQTIVPPSSKERTGYPTQKPVAIARRIISASSPPGGLVADFFAGSGTVGAACLETGRRFLLVDDHPDAIKVMRERFSGRSDVEFLDDASRGTASERRSSA
jgi:site-specific DNA-methyltransferase (adenine-specific)